MALAKRKKPIRAPRQFKNGGLHKTGAGQALKKAKRALFEARQSNDAKLVDQARQALDQATKVCGDIDRSRFEHLSRRHANSVLHATRDLIALLGQTRYIKILTDQHADELLATFSHARTSAMDAIEAAKKARRNGQVRMFSQAAE